MKPIETQLKEAIQKSVQKQFDLALSLDEIIIEIPRDPSFGDYSTNTAMRICKRVKNKPQAVAQKIIEGFEGDAIIAKAEVAGPGFLNFFIKNDTLSGIIAEILTKGDAFGCNDAGKGIKINCEYVSANPTGTLHLGHARGAAWGDSVTRLLKASGYEVTREYYMNDAGNQINNLGLSLYARYREYLGLDFNLPEDGYHGEDVKKIAIEIAQRDGDQHLEGNETDMAFFRKEGVEFEMAKIRNDLSMFRVEFDVWSSEQALRDAHKVEEAVETLEKNGQTYEQDGAIWFKSTNYGDDKDRVLRKSDGSYTYLVPDIAYHQDKYDRGYDKLVNFFGADHHGYITRLKAGIEAMGNDSGKLDVDIIQMVRLVENGEEVKMSKRLGNAVTIRELCDMVGVDAARYFFVSRALDTHFDFDLGLAKSQSNDNPVYYAQYAYARMSSILRLAQTYEKPNDYSLLTHDKEIQLLKYLNEFPGTVADAAMTRSPNKMCNYIQKLASLFHSFYGACKVNDKEHPELSAQRLDLIKACRITLRNALDFIGVEAIEQM